MPINPYAPFLQDYSGAAGAGAAFQGFTEGLKSAQDTSMKRMELQARLNAQQSTIDREKALTQMEALKEGATQDSSGNYVQGPISPRERLEQGVKLFGEGGKATSYDSNGFATGITAEPNSPKMVAARNAGMKFQVGETDKSNNDWEKFATAINNPSSRAALGRYQQNLDKAGTINVLSNQLGMPEGQTPPQGETREQKIARFNKADSRQLYEFAKAADQLTSSANSTVYGTDHLMPKDMQLTAAKIAEWANGAPIPANAGEFIARYLDSANREGGYYKSQRDKAVSGLTAGYAHLQKKDPERWQGVLNAVTQAPSFNDGQAPPQSQSVIKGAGRTGSIGAAGGSLGVVPGQKQAPAQDPQIAAWATQHGLDYAAAAAIIQKRQAAQQGAQ